MPNRSIPRRALLLLVATGAVVGCNDTAYLQPPTDDRPTGPYYTVSGTVIDSLTGQGIPGARISAGPRTTLADASGGWSIDVPEGVATISSSPSSYDPGHETIVVHGSVLLDLQLRRRAPLVIDCEREGAMVHAVLIDLQGRKSVDRFSLTHAVIVAPSGNVTVAAQGWHYFPPPDYYQWPIGIDIPPDAVRIDWDVYDTDGYRYVGSCEFGPPSD